MAELDQFLKKTFAVETAAVTHGAAMWWLPPELGMVEVRLDGLLLVLDPAVLSTLPPPWCLFPPADQVVLEGKMQGDHLDLLAIDRGCLRRQAWQVMRREDKTAPWDGEVPLCLAASHVPTILRERRSVEQVAPGCYRIEPSPFPFVWVAANELPLLDELVPFLVTRSGAKLDDFVGWVKTRRPLEWLLRVLRYLPMTTAAQQDLREFIFSKTDDPAIRARTNMIARWALEAAPEVRLEERLEEARVLLRRVLAVRRFAVSGVDQARIDACTDLDTLQRWHDQAILAANVGEALR